MKPIYQTETDIGKGNCLAACLASILEIGVEKVPDLKSGFDFKAMSDFLALYDVVPIWIRNKELYKSYVGYTPEYCVMIGDSPRHDNLQHAVVGRPNGYGYELVHDPYPDGGGLKGHLTSVIYFGKLKNV